MPNKWIEHVKAFAAKNNLSYGCAISKPECKSSYQSSTKSAKLKELNAKNPIPSPNTSRKMRTALISMKRSNIAEAGSSGMVGIKPSEVYITPVKKAPKAKAPKAKAPKAKAPKVIRPGEKGYKKFIIESP